jgi:hypothetical protein
MAQHPRKVQITLLTRRMKGPWLDAPKLSPLSPIDPVVNEIFIIGV